MGTELDEFFDKLYKQYYKDLLKYAYRLTFEKNFTEEIVQDAFTEAYRKIDTLYKHDNPVGWLYVTVKNIAKAYIREAKAIQNRLELLDCDLIAYMDDSEKMMLYDNLPENEAKLLYNFYIHRKTLNELSQELGISVSACKMRLKRAREKLRKQLFSYDM